MVVICVNGPILLLAFSIPKYSPASQLIKLCVLQGTGVFVDGPGAGKHIQAGAKKVVITAPAKGADIPTYVFGVNEGDYTHDIANIVRLVLPISNTLLLTAKRPTKKEKKKNCRNKLVALFL